MNRPESELRVRPSGSLFLAVVEFCRLLRDAGVDISPACVMLALDALQNVGIADKILFRHALALSLIKRPEDGAIFSVMFDEYWRFDLAEEEETSSEEVSETPAESPTPMDDALVEKILEGFSYEQFWQEDSGDELAQQNTPVAVDEDIELDSPIPSTDSDALRRFVQAFSRRIATAKSRRYRRNKRGELIDFQATIRKSVRSGGLPIELIRRRRQRSPMRLLLFVDVSRSMASYAKLLLSFTSAILRHAWRVEVFLFASEVRRISHSQLQDDDVNVERIIAECGGGTRIGSSILRCLDEYPYILNGSKNIALILSDGLDSGDDEQLETAVRRLRAGCRQLIWLNPTLGLQGYEDATREMTGALPYVDVVAPAHNIDALWQLLDLLRDATNTVRHVA
ncbi:MAG: VWA domain-containing protein [Pseudomonadota bacterium]